MKRAVPASAVKTAVAAWLETTAPAAAEKCLVGVSGGRDSMSLLHALTRSAARPWIVCHLDHAIRGVDAATDACFVRDWAADHDLAVAIARVDVPATAAEHKISLETAARRARQDFFFETARMHGCRELLLAHNADDQVETVLFHLCRGAGARGLSGMSPVDEWRRGDTILRVSRPLLGVWRREIDAYIAEHQIAFREDATNTDPAHTRNRVRHEIIPALNEVFGRAVSPNIRRAAELLAADEDWMESILQESAELATSAEYLACSWLRPRPLAEQRRLIKTWLHARGCPGIGYAEIEATRGLSDASTGPAKINLPDGRHVRRRAGLLFVEPSSD